MKPESVILIVEDDKGLAELLREVVADCGFIPVIVYDAESAVRKFSEMPIYLMVLDYSLPDMTAKELLTKAAAGNLKIPPFIISTGRGNEQTAVEMMKLGALDYIVKDTLYLNLLPTALKRAAREIDNDFKSAQIERDIHALHSLNADMNLGISLGALLHNTRKYINDTFPINQNYIYFLRKDEQHLIIKRKLTSDEHFAFLGPNSESEIPDIIQISLETGNWYSKVMAGGRMMITSSPEDKESMMTALLKGTFPAWPTTNHSVGISPLYNDSSTIVSIPLAVNARKIGLLDIYFGREPSSLDLDRLRTLTEHLVVIIGRKRAEEDLKEKEILFRSITENSFDLISILDKIGKYIYISPAYKSLLGYSPDDLLGFPFSKICFAADRGMINELFNRIASGSQEQAYFLARMVTRSGSIRWIEHKISCINRTDQKSLQFLVMASDVTERKNKEDALYVSNMRYETLFDKASVGIATLSENGTILTVNEAYATMHGCKTSDLPGKNIQEFDTPESAAESRKRFERLLNGETIVFEVAHLHKNGSIIYLQVSSNYVSIGSHKFVLSFSTNITEQKLAREELIKQMLEINRFNKLMIGREQRMIELKTEVNDLRAELGLAKKYGIDNMLSSQNE